MIGLFALGLTAYMIFTLVKNALRGVQLSSEDTFIGSIALIIPVTERSEFYLEPWLKSLNQFKGLQGQLQIHVLVDGHNPAVVAWQEVHQNLPFVRLHTFATRPEDTHPVTWMIQQIAPSIESEVVIIGDGELVPNEHAFHSLGKLVKEKSRPFFVLPQTAKISVIGEAVAVLNPTLALASVFGFKRYSRNISHPLMSIAQGWIGMPLPIFRNLNFSQMALPSWKQEIAQQWERNKVTYGLAFGEKHLKRFYPEHLKVQIAQMRIYWEELWRVGDRTGLFLFAVALFLWFFPFLYYTSHPFWALATFGLLLIYRFFSKVVFQESWGTLLLHPIGCVVWLGTFFWWIISRLRSSQRT